MLLQKMLKSFFLCFSSSRRLPIRCGSISEFLKLSSTASLIKLKSSSKTSSLACSYSIIRRMACALRLECSASSRSLACSCLTLQVSMSKRRSGDYSREKSKQRWSRKSWPSERNTRDSKSSWIRTQLPFRVWMAAFCTQRGCSPARLLRIDAHIRSFDLRGGTGAARREFWWQWRAQKQGFWPQRSVLP